MSFFGDPPNDFFFRFAPTPQMSNGRPLKKEANYRIYKTNKSDLEVLIFWPSPLISKLEYVMSHNSLQVINQDMCAISKRYFTVYMKLITRAVTLHNPSGIYI